MHNKNYKSPQTETERAFAAIWQQLLKKDNIGVHDNFFELGGHSFLAVKVIKMINALGYTLELKDIFLNQTIAELSKKANGYQDKLIEAKEDNPSEGVADKLNSYHKQQIEYLIPIQKEGDLPPFFVVHSLWAYIELAAQLGKNQPFYCLEEAKFDRLEDIASFYINKIKNVQPRGPYYLGGFCKHGFIALEMARQLVAQGEEVAALFMFETYSPTGVIPRLSWKYMKLSYNKLVSWPSLNKKRYLKDEIRQAAKMTLYAFIKFLTKRDLVKTFSGKIILAKPRPYDFSYNGKVVLVRSDTKEIWAKDDHEMGWSKYFTGEIEVFTIEGSHTDIFIAPGVIKLAKIIKRVLENSRNYVISI